MIASVIKSLLWSSGNHFYLFSTIKSLFWCWDKLVDWNLMVNLISWWHVLVLERQRRILLVEYVIPNRSEHQRFDLIFNRIIHISDTIIIHQIASLKLWESFLIFFLQSNRFSEAPANNRDSFLEPSRFFEAHANCDSFLQSNCFSDAKKINWYFLL